MYLQSFKTKGIKGIKEEFSMNFQPDLKEEFYEKNIEKFGFDDIKYKDFWVLKQICIVGKNATGKSSILKSIQMGYKSLIDNNFTSKIHSYSLRNFGANIYNVFQNEVFWEFKIVFKENNILKRYTIKQKLKNNLYEEESLSIQFINEKGIISKEFKVYNLLKNKLTLFKKNKIYKKFNHKTKNISIFSMIYSSTINLEISNFMSEHSTLIKKIKFLNNSTNNENIHFLKIPDTIQYIKKINKELKKIDNNFVEIKLDNVGEHVWVISDGKTNKEFKGLNKITEFISLGTKKYINFMFEIFFIRKLMPFSITLIDELGDSLNSSLVNDLWKKIIKSNQQIIFTTHNNDFFKFEIRNDQIFKIENIKNKVQALKFSDFYNNNGTSNYYESLEKFLGL